MPEATVYLCDKTEGLKGEHKECVHAVGGDGVALFLTVGKPYAAEADLRRELQFCSRWHANYWLIRQRVAQQAP